MKSNKQGFTLIELLVVIAIIGLLASIVLASLNSARKKSRDARRLADLKQLQNALELYANDNGGNYPSDAVTVTAAGEAVSAATANGMADQLVPSYIAAIPNDPLGGTVTYYFRTDPAANTAANATAYCISAGLENTPPTPANSCTFTPSTSITTNEYSVGS